MTSALVTHDSGASAAATDEPSGTITISDAVVAKLASRAVLEVPDAGGAVRRVLGRAVPGAGHLGIRETSLATAPKASADVDGSVAHVEVTISVRWPVSIRQVTEQLRDHLRERLHALTGLTVAEVRITVNDLVTNVAPTGRVR
ncbi:Asp23/Gls24 family envelope stress response protein [Phytohabitans sp. LJ34]|uniref:Asp23/Gls24 family envelope stress response protein n=1 Tax=Phytohabitans sp. LJ34 TaxID=3452217 RepID=UPI003F888E51